MSGGNGMKHPNDMPLICEVNHSVKVEMAR